MTGTGTYLGFVVAGNHHGIPAVSVQEMLHVPLFQRTERVPGCVIGLFNLRGQSVAVLDLATLLGVAPSTVRDDQVLVLFRPSADAAPVAILVDIVDDLVTFQDDEIEAPMTDRESGSAHPLVRALGLRGERVYHLLDPQVLVERALAATGDSRYPAYFDNLSETTWRTLQGRAEACAEFRAHASAQTHPVAVFSIGGERFGVALEQVREIIPSPRIYRVPGIPAGFLGLASHGGEPMPVVDIRALLGMPVQGTAPLAHLLVVDDEQQSLALCVDQVEEVLDLDLDLVRPNPAWTDHDFISGEWVLPSGLVALLSLSDLLKHPALAVPE